MKLYLLLIVCSLCGCEAHELRVQQDEIIRLRKRVIWSDSMLHECNHEYTKHLIDDISEKIKTVK